MRAREFLNGKPTSISCWFSLLLLIVVTGCGGSSSGSNHETNDITSPNLNAEWQSNLLLSLHSSGTVTPNLKAVQGIDGKIHIIYFSDAPPEGENLLYTLNYLIYTPDEDLLLQQNPKPTGPETGGHGLDNSHPAALALDADDTPIIAYQGGAFRPMGEEEQSDVMISLIEEIDWAEYTGAIGYVERNPFFDGLAKPDLDLAVDSNGDIHLCFQFFYEGIDADNLLYPDVNYVHKIRSDLSQPADAADWATWEETVHGNDFQTTYGEHNSVGYHCRIVMDSADQPVVIYAEHTENTGMYALWAARRNGPDAWERELIDQFGEAWRVNAVSAARSPVDGSLAVAYQLNYMGSDGDYGDHLRFSQYINGSWGAPIIVDESSWCGDDVALTFDPAGRPAIAYFDDHSHAGHSLQNLKLARFDGAAWQTETVAEEGDIGHYNSIWFDGAERINICSYSRSTDAIFIFSKAETF